MRRRTYNPAQLTPEELKSTFIARHESLTQMLHILRRQESGRPCQHLLLVGARGMGKTTLGLRFLQAVKEKSDLAAAWQPVPFDEESYSVTNLGEFWLAALQHLARATGEERWRNRADELRRSEPDANRRESYALASLLDFCEAGRRVILFVESLDLIFEQIGDERDLFALRSALIGHPELLLVGSANAVFDGIRHHDAPFYEFFQCITLSGLGPDACRAVFEETFRREGKSIPADVLSAELGRVESIRSLTGGNPRLLVLAARILMESPLGSAFEDLERLIDEQTPYFKALMEALPVQARKVFHYLAGEWTPLRARDIAAGANLTPSHISAQLRQLTDKGYVHEVRVAGEARARYEVVDRFYNIYYLLRFTQAGRARLARFVTFLHDLYGEGGMHALYGEALHSIRRSMPATELADWIQAFSSHVTDDHSYAAREAWFEEALKTSIERLGADAPVLDELQDRAPETALNVYLESSNEFVEANRFAEAEAVLRRAAKHWGPNRHLILCLIGLVQAMDNNPDGALATFEQAVMAAPTDEDLGRKVAVESLMSTARLRLELGEHDAATKAARDGWNLVRESDEELRRYAALSLRGVAQGLWEGGKRETARSLWLLAPSIVTRDDREELRLEAVKSLFQAASKHRDIDEYERSCEILRGIDGLVAIGDGSAIREVRLVGLILEGSSHRALGRGELAVAVWRRAVEFVHDDDRAETAALAATCLVAASLELMTTWEPGENDDALMAESREVARMAVELAPENAWALQVYGWVLALSGDWEESMTLVGRSLAKLGENEWPTGMLDTLIHVAARGHIAEVREFMAETRLEKDLEALWNALALELGQSVAAMPAEMDEAVGRVRERLAKQRELLGRGS